MLTLYPAIKTFAEHRLDVGDGHNLYIEESGKEDGIPILFIHGGPGAGTDALQRRYFAPDDYRIILFDQRGCGRSKPHASIDHNTTQDLINDIEKIREFLGIKKWLLCGGSWGSTLSLLYAQQHPSKVMGFVLRSIFLARRKDIQWIENGPKFIFPDYWQKFVSILSDNEESSPLAAYYKRLIGDDDLSRMAAAKSYVTFESKCATLSPNPRIVERSQEPYFAKALALIACHYLTQDCFIKDNQIIDNIATIKDIPSIIIHGRYDMITPLENAWTLHQSWPKSELYIIRNAGHATSEAAIVDALVHATREMAKLFRH